MSRLGKKPLPIPDKVTVTFNNHLLDLTGPVGKLQHPINKKLTVTIDKDKKHVLVEPAAGVTNEEASPLQGLTRGIVKNALEGVVSGFKRDLEVHGLGYKVAVDGKKLNMQVGFSHPVAFTIPEGVKVAVDKQTLISITGVDKNLVGETAARIRLVKPPEPYQGTGIRYAGEHIIRKAGKAAAGASGGSGGGKK